jgi:hypothetical protein
MMDMNSAPVVRHSKLALKVVARIASTHCSGREHAGVMENGEPSALLAHVTVDTGSDY